MVRSMLARLVSQRTVDDWLRSLPQSHGIHLLSADTPFIYAEEGYDAEYGHEETWIDENLGSWLLDAAGFAPETVLEIACGTGLLTGALLHHGRVRRLVASDGSEKFLAITRRKMANLATFDRLSLLRMADRDFGAIPAGLFDAIMMRSALHHFVDFRDVAATLIGKLRPGGGLFMLEPRADFHITSSLILKSVKAKAGPKWTADHDRHAQAFVDAANFYLNRTWDKAAYEDKHAFHTEEMVSIANQNGAQLSVLGGEGDTSFSACFRDFLRYCMSVPADVLADIIALASDELAFMDRAYESRPRYGAAEWFLFRKP